MLPPFVVSSVALGLALQPASGAQVIVYHSETSTCSILMQQTNSKNIPGKDRKSRHSMQGPQLLAVASLSVPSVLRCRCKVQQPHRERLVLSSSSSRSVNLYSWINPAASRILCQTSQPPHCAKTRPFSHAMGFIMRFVVAPVQPCAALNTSCWQACAEARAMHY